jgi:CRP-like cAMP-binding protein
MAGLTRKPFDSEHFLATEEPGRSIRRLRAKEFFFDQGGAADSVYYLQSGHAKLTVVSKRGKEATVTMLIAGDFFGEEAMASDDELRTSSAMAVSACCALKIERRQMLKTLHEEHTFSDFFMKFILIRGVRTQADLIDQLFNSSERRLARTLLLMAEYGQPGELVTLLQPITQETLAEMIGTTRSRVSFFMNRFRKLGYIEYNGRIQVNKSLLDMVLHDTLPEENASRPTLLDPRSSTALTAKRAKLVKEPAAATRVKRRSQPAPESR